MSATCRVRSLTRFPWLQSQATAIIQSPTNSLFWHVNCQWLVGCFFSALFSKTASLGNWESQTADKMSPRELSLVSHTHKQPRRRSDTHSPFSSVLSLLLLHAHAHAHTILKISHQLPVKLSSTHLRLIKPESCCLSHSHRLPPFKDGDLQSYVRLMMTFGHLFVHKSR